MENKIQVTICLGSSCFSRKNRDVVDALQEFLTNRHLNNIVSLKGGHCFEKCSQGPIMIVDDQIFTQITPQKAVAIVESFVINNQ
jgi:NADH:ubiquinone oxidoreductase subunit E